MGSEFYQTQQYLVNHKWNGVRALIIYPYFLLFSRQKKVSKKNAFLYCNRYIRFHVSGHTTGSSPALMTKLCRVTYGRLPYHAPASKDAIHPLWLLIVVMTTVSFWGSASAQRIYAFKNNDILYYRLECHYCL